MATTTEVSAPELTSEASPPGAPPATQESKVGEISQTRLMLRRFRQSKMAVAALILLVLMYLGAAFAPFLSPNAPGDIDQDYKYAAPSSLTWNGGPAMCTVTQEIDPINISTSYVKNCDQPVALQVMGRGFEYKVLGLIPSDRHLITITDEDHRLLVFGADGNGRDIFSRTIYGARVSMTIGLIGVIIAAVLGSLIGTISGYAGGKVDNVLQRFIEIIMSVPTLPFVGDHGGSDAPGHVGHKRYFVMTLILSLVAWTGLARQVRGKVMGYAKSDYVAAARSAGSSGLRIVTTHLMPNAASHIVAVSMLAVPTAILAETALSFLGIGMLDPAISWGVLLQDASRIDVLQQYPWLLIPGVAVIVAITCFQLLGDGVRDAVDPYS